MKTSVKELLLESLKIEGETGNEKGISDFYADQCRQLGLDVFQDDNNNVIAVLDSSQGKIINFNGHMDTKPVDNIKPRIEDSLVYGRGACDMRGGIASMLDSAEALVKNKQMKGKVVYTFVVCEESGSREIRQRGTPSVIEYLQKNGLTPDAVIIGESSQTNYSKTEIGYTLCDGERGRYTIDITIVGEAAHGAWGSELGINAHALAGKIVHELCCLERNGKIDKESNLHAKFGIIEEGTHNLVPDTCPIQIDIRYSSNIALKGIMKDVLESVKNNLNYGEKKGEYSFKGTPIGNPCTNIENIFIEKLLCAYRTATGKEPNKTKSKFGTDGRLIRELLGKNIPIYIAGPGYQYIAHTKNENVPIQHLKDYSRIYTETVLSYLSR